MRRRVVSGLLAVLSALAIAGPDLAAQDSAATEPWRIITPPQASLVLARDGSLIGEIGRERRLSVPLSTLPPYVPQAFIAVEDKRFYEHDGVDLVGVAAAIKDAATGGDLRGASTITQLLVGNMHPEVIDRRDRSISRKLREQAAAREMERHYSKAQILEAFLNQISFGRGIYGIELAARHWFGKSASQLTLAEAASLAAMPKSPVQYDPGRYPERNRQRRDLVLALMRDQGFITPVEAGIAQRQPLVVADDFGAVPAPWLLDIARVQAERAGVDVRAGGYRLVTTIDPVAQRAAVTALAATVAEVEARDDWVHGSCTAEKRAANRCVEGALVAVDPASGDVRALVGGRDFTRAPFDRAVNGRRQPGSSFKPFVYAAAIANGWTAASLVADTALDLVQPNGAHYQPRNADGDFLGLLPMRDALARSRNPVAVQLALDVGLDSVGALAARAGLDAAIAPYPSSALGASAVQPLDFVASYAAFANGGWAVEPRLLQRVEDAAGRPVRTLSAAAPTPAIDPRVAFIVRDMLRDVVDRGTGTAIRRFVPTSVPVAGKTGTTNDNSDVWFVGMTPTLVAGAWLGFDVPAPLARGAAGGTLAAPVVGRLLASVGSGNAARDAQAWAPPPGVVPVTLARGTAVPATADTPFADRYVEWFIAGTEPGAEGTWPWRLFRRGAIAY